MKNKNGFTLVEMVLVILLIGIITALAVPNMTAYNVHAASESLDVTARTIFVAAQNRLTELRTTNVDKLNHPLYDNAADADNSAIEIGILDVSTLVGTTEDGYRYLYNDPDAPTTEQSTQLRALLRPVLTAEILNMHIIITIDSDSYNVLSVVCSDEKIAIGDTITDRMGVSGTSHGNLIGESNTAGVDIENPDKYDLGRIKLELLDGAFDPIIASNDKQVFSRNMLYAKITMTDEMLTQIGDDVYTFYMGDADKREIRVSREDTSAHDLPTKNVFEIAFNSKGTSNGYNLLKAILNDPRGNATESSGEKTTIVRNSYINETATWRDTYIENEGEADERTYHVYYVILDYVVGDMTYTKLDYGNDKSINYKYQIEHYDINANNIEDDNEINIGDGNMYVGLVGEQVDIQSNAYSPFFGPTNTVASPRHLYNVRYDLDGDFLQTADIINETASYKEGLAIYNFPPIGDISNPFVGTYTSLPKDDQDPSQGNFVIGNFVIDDSKIQNQDSDDNAYVGLFGAISTQDNTYVPRDSDSNVKTDYTERPEGLYGVHLVDMVVGTRDGAEYVGGLVGHADNGAVIYECIVEDSVILGANYVGGLVGYVDNANYVDDDDKRTAIYNSLLYNSRVNTKTTHTGAIAGYLGANSYIRDTNVIFDREPTASEEAFQVIGNSTAGGIVGENHGMIADCVFYSLQLNNIRLTGTEVNFNSLGTIVSANNVGDDDNGKVSGNMYIARVPDSNGVTAPLAAADNGDGLMYNISQTELTDVDTENQKIEIVTGFDETIPHHTYDGEGALIMTENTRTITFKTGNKPLLFSANMYNFLDTYFTVSFDFYASETSAGSDMATGTAFVVDNTESSESTEDFSVTLNDKGNGEFDFSFADFQTVRMAIDEVPDKPVPSGSFYYTITIEYDESTGLLPELVKDFTLTSPKIEVKISE